MARTYSWLPRLHEIRKAVADSPRSHYTRADLQDLFHVQQSPAARLMDVLPTVRMNMGLLVERDALLAFLDRVRESDDVSGLVTSMKAAKSAPSRKAMRSLVRRTYEPVGFEGLPSNVEMNVGHLAIRFETLDELLTALFALARLLTDELDEFARRYEPAKPQKTDEAALDMKRLWDDLDTMKSAGLGRLAELGLGRSDGGAGDEAVAG